MKNILTVFIFIFGLVPVLCLAEGGCPEGYYPQNGAGWQGCAPGPGVNNSGEGSTPRVVVDGYWEKTWGAVAGTDTPPVGVTVTGKTSEKLAIKAAVEKCEAKGGKGCKATFTYFNQCLAIAQVTSGVGLESQVADGSIELAKTGAVDSCRKLNGGKVCSAIFAECTKPIYHRY